MPGPGGGGGGGGGGGLLDMMGVPAAAVAPTQLDPGVMQGYMQLLGGGGGGGGGGDFLGNYILDSLRPKMVDFAHVQDNNFYV